MSTSIQYDRLGFPMVWREEVGAYVHWLPVTKIQFEYFLCDAPDAHFDAGWYEAVLRLNPRVTPRRIDSRNYYRALMTGVRPAEAQRFANWCGDGYRLPTEVEWLALYRSLRTQPAESLASTALLDGQEPRVRELLERIDAAVCSVCERVGSGPSLAAQTLLRFGAMEWVRVGTPPTAWSYKGEPIPEFCGNLELVNQDAEALTADPEEHRFAVFGFRLLYLPPTEPDDDSREKSISHIDPTNGEQSWDVS